MQKAINELYIKNIEKVKSEIESYSNNKKLWIVTGEIKNSAGNLALHICGNLQYFIGAIIGKSEYVRDRDKEFSDKDVPTSELISIIDQTIEVVNSALIKLKKEDLEQIYPLEFFGYPMTTGHLLIQMLNHLVYHLGQINYHRRLLDN